MRAYSLHSGSDSAEWNAHTSLHLCCLQLRIKTGVLIGDGDAGSVSIALAQMCRCSGQPREGVKRRLTSWSDDGTRICFRSETYRFSLQWNYRSPMPRLQDSFQERFYNDENLYGFMLDRTLIVVLVN